MRNLRSLAGFLFTFLYIIRQKPVIEMVEAFWVKVAIGDIFYAQAETVISSASERQPEMRESGEHSFGFRSLSERSELAEKVDKMRRRRSSRTGFVSGGRKTVLP